MYDRAVNGHSIAAQPAHDLPVKQHRQDAHGHVHKESRKAGNGDSPELFAQPLRAHQAQGILPAHKVDEHHQKGYARADGRGQARAVNAHIAGEHEEIIAEYIKNAPGQHAHGGQARVSVIAQEPRQQLVQQEQREHRLDGLHIPLGQGQQRFIRAEEGENGPLKAPYPHPCQGSQYHRADGRCGKILVFAAVPAAAATPGAEQHAAADAHQQAQAVDNVPQRCYHRQGRRTLRPLILPHHSHIHDGVNGGDQSGAKGRRQIFKINGLDFPVQKLHAALLLFQEKTDKKQASQLVSYPAAASPNSSPSELSGPL